MVLEGGTEVVLDLRVLDVRYPASMADAKVSWRKGDIFVIKGVWTLERDMSDALEAVLMPASVEK